MRCSKGQNHLAPKIFTSSYLFIVKNFSSYLELLLLLAFLFMWLLRWILVVALGIFSCDMWDIVPRPGIKLQPLAL